MHYRQILVAAACATIALGVAGAQQATPTQHASAQKSATVAVKPDSSKKAAKHKRAAKHKTRVRKDTTNTGAAKP